ncbi:hypothetical protein FRX31_025392 [Thalictrum thalictroides]|uniref:Uncharacterized protein n=1 Tax=Thalictrum thalictroides TaxID=46969 RepID=A0A7J6VJT1_THATH|nr:hypothetical protein FRX31_025392 [Thalictrum thalictroides]
MGSEAEVVEEHSSRSQPHVANFADITQTIESWTRAEIGGTEVIATEKERNFTTSDSDCNEDFIDDNDVDDFAMVKQKRKQSLSNENGSSSKQEWVRGPSKLVKVFQQPPGSKLQLFWNDNGQPCGPDTHPSLYSESIGVLIATSRRFNWTKSWDKQFLDQTPEEAPEQPPGEAPEQPPREAPEQPKDWLWRKIKEYWEKHHYSCYDTYDDVVANKPEHLSYQEWAILTGHWETEEHQVLSHRNKSNRAAQRAQHATGRISFPQLREKINREQGAPPTQGDFFKATHISRKTNEPIDELSRHYIVSKLHYKFKIKFDIVWYHQIK